MRVNYSTKGFKPKRSKSKTLKFISHKIALIDVIETLWNNEAEPLSNQLCAPATPSILSYTECAIDAK
jgi:hypothetical protein